MRGAYRLLAAALGAALTVQANGATGVLEALGVGLHGFVDGRAGVRTSDDPYEDDMSLGEVRLQLDAVRAWDAVTAQVRADFLYDDVAADRDLDLESGQGWLDLREANLLIPLSISDVKVGRQILTWGTGDLLFVNDLFPKDWQSFLSGRDEEYLKAPSDAAMVSLFPGPVNVDLVYTPRFDPDRFISGERLSYWNPVLGRRAGQDAVARPSVPDEWFDDAELAARVSRNLSGVELAVYAYDGFWKSPEAFDPGSMQPAFAALSVYGASVRGAVRGGLMNAEYGFYDSRDDRSGDDAFVPNSQQRVLVGYERELARDLTGAVQYYLEYMSDHGAYRAALPEGMKAKDEDRHVLTARLTQRAMNQNLVLSLFVFYSPSDGDAYIRPVAKYSVSDQWMVTAGANVFSGVDDHTFFNQFEKNSNVYAGARYSF